MHENGRNVNYRIETNPNDPQGRTIIFVNPSTNLEIGRDTLTGQVIEKSALHSLLIENPDGLAVSIIQNHSGKIISYQIVRRE